MPALCEDLRQRLSLKIKYSYSINDLIFNIFVKIFFSEFTVCRYCNIIEVRLSGLNMARNF